MIDAYNTEGRDAAWAPAMEDALRARFSADVLPEWLRPLSVEEMDCRATACKFVLSYPASLENIAAERAAAEGLPPDTTPLGFAIIETGAMGRIITRVSTEHAVGPDGTLLIKRTSVVAFGVDEHNPASYAAWVEDRRKKGATLRQKMIDGWRARQAALGQEPQR